MVHAWHNPLLQYLRGIFVCRLQHEAMKKLSLDLTWEKCILFWVLNMEHVSSLLKEISIQFSDA